MIFKAKKLLKVDNYKTFSKITNDLKYIFQKKNCLMIIVSEKVIVSRKISTVNLTRARQVAPPLIATY